MLYNGVMQQEVDGVLVAAHELKAPLAVLRQLALSFEGAGVSDERIKNQMVSVSERALRQVNDLSKIRRLEDGLFEMEPVAVREVCDAVTRELRYLFRYNERDFTVKYSNKMKLVTANRELLYSVLYNFLLNAMHYSDAKTNSRLTVRDHRGSVRVDVRDFGPALPVEVWRELRYGQIDKPLPVAMRPNSSGLGLYIASTFSRYMGAKVGVVRHRDGTSFYVELPISKQASLFGV